VKSKATRKSVKTYTCYDFFDPPSKERGKAKHFTLDQFHVSLLGFWWDFGSWFCCHIGEKDPLRIGLVS